MQGANTKDQGPRTMATGAGRTGQHHWQWTTAPNGVLSSLKLMKLLIDEASQMNEMRVHRYRDRCREQYTYTERNQGRIVGNCPKYSEKSESLSIKILQRKHSHKMITI